MKLILEGASILSGHYEDELNESTGATERNYYIEGIFSTPEKKNRNGRVYSRSIWEREVAKYQDEINNVTINTLCEYQHPPRSSVDQMEAVARIVELKFDENGNVVGKAKILNDNTDKTNKLKGLIKEGMKIGVSSRGVGSVSNSGIVEDFKLITYDVVDTPSDYNAMLNGIIEGHKFENGILVDKDFQIDENGCIGEACNIMSESTDDEDEEIKPNTPTKECKVKKAIDKAITELKTELKDEIFADIVEFIEDKDKELVEGISNYMESLKDTIYKKIEEKNIEKNDDAIASELLKAFKR